MKKTLLFVCGCLLSLASPLCAQVESLEQFQAKLKGLYYDPRREGMKGFSCLVKSDLMDKAIPGGLEGELIKAYLKLNLSASYGKDGIKLYPAKFDGSHIKKEDTKVIEWIKLLNGLRDVVEMELQAWAMMTLPAGTPKGGGDVKSAAFQKTESGFEIALRDKSGAEGTLVFDPDLKLTSVTERMKGKGPTVIHVDYEKTSKGLRLRGCDWTYGKSTYKATALYRSVQDYDVPKEIRINMTQAGSQSVSIFDRLQFDKYDIDW